MWPGSPINRNRMTDPLQHATRLLRNARKVCVSTGAGMSAESGVAMFRDRDGLWSKFNPAELATPSAFARDPRRVWEWYRARRAQLQSVAPHAGHRVLALWESRFEQYVLITQNVDGLHHRAGSSNVIELHGRIDEARCESCEYRVRGLDDLGPDPHCPTCGRRVRPGVVWFGEMLPPGAWERAAEAAHRCDLLLVIGTSGVVQPAASLADLARQGGAKIIEINPQRTSISALADAHLVGTCGAMLSALEAQLASPPD